MSVIQDVDIKIILQRLRPGSEYHWAGSSDTGNDMGVILEWRDPDTVIPTEAEMIAEWDNYVIEQDQATAIQAAARADLDDVKDAAITAALASVDSDLALLTGSPNNATVLQIIGRLLNRQKRIIKALRHLV